MYFVFDVGGTKIRTGISIDGAELSQVKIFPTPKKYQEGVSLLTRSFLETTKNKKIKLVAGGVPGRLDKQKSKLLGSVNLPDWLDKPLQKDLVRNLKAAVYLANDADLAGLGESVYGAGRGFEIVSYLTISTGIGGVRITNNVIDKARVGFEPGKQIINCSDKELANYPVAGVLESYVSGIGFSRRYNKDISKVKNKKIWQQAINKLSYGIHNVIVFWSPDIIILGGGAMESKYINLPDINSNLKKWHEMKLIPQIKKAELGDRSGLYGAIYYLKSKQYERS